MTNEEAHRLAREKGASRVAVALVRGIVVPFFRIWFRLTSTGGEYVPQRGAGIITPNHKSFWDAFFVAASIKRTPRFMGKSELFEGRRGRLLIRLGAFPVRRGEADADALETAREVLRQGDLLSLFPEGTRIRAPDALGKPKRGAVRLALESGAPLVPAAITGTEALFVGPFPKPRPVRVAFGEPIPVEQLEATPEAAAQVLDEQLWPEVETQFKGLLARKGLIAAGLAAAGLGGAAIARNRRSGRSKWPARGGSRRRRGKRRGGRGRGGPFG